MYEPTFMRQLLGRPSGTCDCAESETSQAETLESVESQDPRLDGCPEDLEIAIREDMTAAGQFGGELLNPKDILPRNGSSIRSLAGLDVHCVAARPRQSDGKRLACCFHGFGASSLSWAPAIQTLANDLDAEVVAFDQPGFGLTERPDLEINESALATSAYKCERGASIALSLLGAYRTSKKPIFIAHSLGAIGASLAALQLVEHGQPDVTLVLVGPAFSVDGAVSPLPRCSLWRLRVLSWVLPPILRQIVYRRRFWERGLASANNGEVPNWRVVMDYRWPCLAQGWDQGLTNFVMTRLHGTLEEEGLAVRLQAACQKHGLRVLVVSGADDAIAPNSNSQALAAAIGAEYAEMPGGHMPHEGSPSMFANIVRSFVQR
mmetsp:Transcript_64612/g.120299  ORF Transcript_64612/g.120299 Transcript_64612/m.120299 type:complete len:377 (-) Transcript_64612:37-1167(-)